MSSSPLWKICVQPTDAEIKRMLFFPINFGMRGPSSPLFKGPTKHPNCSNIVECLPHSHSCSLPLFGGNLSVAVASKAGLKISSSSQS